MKLKIKKKLKIKESDFEGFQLPEMSVKKCIKLYLGFQLCSQKYRMIIKYLYFISGF
jgi:hypothetical protein